MVVCCVTPVVCALVAEVVTIWGLVLVILLAKVVLLGVPHVFQALIVPIVLLDTI